MLIKALKNNAAIIIIFLSSFAYSIGLYAGKSIGFKICLALFFFFIAFQSLVLFSNSYLITKLKNNKLKIVAAIILVVFTFVWIIISIGNIFSNKFFFQGISFFLLVNIFKNLGYYVSTSGLILIFVSVLIFVIVFIKNYKKIIKHYENIWNIYNVRYFLIISIIFSSTIYLFLIINSKNQLVAKNSFHAITIAPQRFDPILTLLRSKKDINEDIYRNNIFNLVKKSKNHKKSNVVIIIVDAMRAKSLKPYGYERSNAPFIEEMYAKRKFQKVDNAFSLCNSSPCGIMGMLASQGPNTINPYNIKIYDILRVNDYNINFYLSGIHSSWDGLGDHYGPNIDNFNEFADSSDEKLVDKLKNIKEANPDSPNFFFIHLMSTHLWGIRNKKYSHFTPEEKYIADLFLPRIKPFDADLFLKPENKSKQEYTNYYDNGIFQTDQLIKEIFNTLKEKGFLDDAILIITSDHGEALGERGKYYFGHSSELYNELIKIPIFIYDTSNTEYKNLFFATQEDISPTILDRLDIKKPFSWKGFSILDEKQRKFSFHKSQSHFNFEGIMVNEGFYSIIKPVDGKILKLLRIQRGNNVRQQLFNITDDPEEKEPLSHTHPEFNSMNNLLNENINKF